MFCVTGTICQSEIPVLHHLTMKDSTMGNITSSKIDINETLPINATSKKDDDPFWLIFMDRSQLVMTLIGVIANTATFITLIKNKQVCKVLP